MYPLMYIVFLILGVAVCWIYNWWYERRYYHRVKRRQDKKEDIKLKQRLDQLENEIFDFEKDAK